MNHRKTNRKRSKYHLRKRIVSILKNREEPISAIEMMDLLIQSGLSQNFIPKNSNALGQIMKATKGVHHESGFRYGVGDTSYRTNLYHLESEADFTEWLENLP
jgi:hypothetical protein